jgi:hemin uptake protein HemP
MVADPGQPKQVKLSNAAAPPPRVLRSEDLLAGERMVVIEHGGAQYRLLVTRNDRLILQK